MLRNIKLRRTSSATMLMLRTITWTGTQCHTLMGHTNSTRVEFVWPIRVWHCVPVQVIVRSISIVADDVLRNLIFLSIDGTHKNLITVNVISCTAQQFVT